MDSRLRRLDLVAHRGYPVAFPENTLLGYRQAVFHGARFVETDIQCTRDGVPVLYHDDCTRRMSGADGSVTGRTLDALLKLDAACPGRFGERFAGTPIPTLDAFADWLVGYRAVTAFVEIKIESLEEFGVADVTAQVMKAIESVRDQCVIISFDDRCIEYVTAHYRIRTGWVLDAWNPATESRARDLAPDFLFVDDEIFPDGGQLWPGPWQWAVYVINDLCRALSWADQDVGLVETDAIGEMLDQYRAGYLE